MSLNINIEVQERYLVAYLNKSYTANSVEECIDLLFTNQKLFNYTVEDLLIGGSIHSIIVYQQIADVTPLNIPMESGDILDYVYLENKTVCNSEEVLNLVSKHEKYDDLLAEVKSRKENNVTEQEAIQKENNKIKKENDFHMLEYIINTYGKEAFDKIDELKGVQ